MPDLIAANGVSKPNYKAVLVRIRADDRWLGDHVNLALPMGRAMEQASRRGFNDQAGRAIAQLRCSLGAPTLKLKVVSALLEAVVVCQA